MIDFILKAYNLVQQEKFGHRKGFNITRQHSYDHNLKAL